MRGVGQVRRWRKGPSRWSLAFDSVDMYGAGVLTPAGETEARSITES